MQDWCLCLHAIFWHEALLFCKHCLGWLLPSLPPRSLSQTIAQMNQEGKRTEPKQGQLLSMSLREHCRAWSGGRITLLFSLQCLAISQVCYPQRQLLYCAGELKWHMPGHVFLQFYNEFCSFWDSPQISSFRKKGKRKKGKGEKEAELIQHSSSVASCLYRTGTLYSLKIQ